MPMENTGMKQIEKLVTACRDFHSAFTKIDPLIMQWGAERPSLKKTLRTLLDWDKTGRFPESYGSSMAGNYLLGLILTNPVASAKLLREQEHLLTPRTASVLQYWVDHPAYWAYFKVVEFLEHDFMQILDLSSGELHLLHSPAIVKSEKDHQTQGKNRLCLMLPNDGCLQTAGIIHFYSFDIEDMEFYCSLIDKQSFEIGGLGAVINANFPKFFKLDTISTIPIIYHKEEPLRIHWKLIHAPMFRIESLKGSWETKNKGQMTSYTLTDADEQLRSLSQYGVLWDDLVFSTPKILIDRDSEDIALYTHGRIAYDALAHIIGSAYPTLAKKIKEPDYSLNVLFDTFLKKEGYQLPWSSFDALMDSPKKEKNSPHVDAINRALSQYIESRNTGSEFDLEKVAKNEGLAADELKDLIETVDAKFKSMVNSYEVSEEDRVFELSGWPVPPPSERNAFSEGLEESQLFEIDDSYSTEDAIHLLTNDSYADTIEEKGLIAFYEDLFIEKYGHVRGLALMNTFFYILCYKGSDWIPIRSYALEILKLFSNVVLGPDGDSEAFIKQFSRFVARSLCSRGLCSLSSIPSKEDLNSGKVPIKATDAFYSFLAIRE